MLRLVEGRNCPRLSCYHKDGKPLSVAGLTLPYRSCVYGGPEERQTWCTHIESGPLLLMMAHRLLAKAALPHSPPPLVAVKLLHRRLTAGLLHRRLTAGVL